MAECLLPSFRHPERVSAMFMDHLMFAVGHHIAATYGGMTAKALPKVGGLSPLMERRAKELLMADMGGTLRLTDLAAACGLSASQFSRAFRRSVGMPPHRWLVQQRVERAKGLLRDSPTSLSEIALTSGFSDQSHFTRSFSAWPRAARRLNGPAS
jgi:transcriptional regulator GlxA family with amidase domain